MEFLSAKHLPGLFGALRTIKGKREDDLAAIQDLLGINHESLSRYYVPPRCQAVSPYSDQTHYTVPLFLVINDFLNKEIASPSPGKNQFFILADAGTGKTSFLSIVHYTSLAKFWPSQYFTHLEKLGQGTLGKLDGIRDKGHCILLLDSLDEDPSAMQDIKTYLLFLLRATRNFYRVLITCRTQFFPAQIELAGYVEIEGFKCEATYLSPFNDAEVVAYLEKRYGARKNKKAGGLLTTTSSHGKSDRIIAEDLVRLMGDLSSRPLLLANLEDIIEEHKRNERIGDPSLGATEYNAYGLYRLLIEGWLRREQEKISSLRSQPPSVEQLLKACTRIAFKMQCRGRVDQRVLKQDELSTIRALHSDVGRLELLDLKGRALLIRDGDGNYRFAHYSIQEFLVIQGVLDSNVALDDLSKGEAFLTTPFMFELLEQISHPKLDREKYITYLPRLGHDGIDRRVGTQTQGASYMRRFNLRGINLSECRSQYANFDFSGCEFQDANLADVSFDFVNLEGAKLTRANLVGAKLSTANARGVVLNHADLSRAKLNAANFCQAQMVQANLSDADLSDIDLQEADLSKASLRGANLSRANLSHANLSGADLSGANLSGANLSDAIHLNAIFTNAILTGASNAKDVLEKLNRRAPSSGR